MLISGEAVVYRLHRAQIYSPCLSPNILLKFCGCLRDWITVDLTLEESPEVEVAGVEVG